MKELIQQHKERLEEVDFLLNNISTIKNKTDLKVIKQTINELELEKSLRLSFISELENLYQELGAEIRKIWS